MKRHPTHLLAYAVAAVGLLAACAVDAENPPIVVPATDEGRAFLDDYLTAITGDVPEQSPAPTRWQDLMTVPGLDPR